MQTTKASQEAGIEIPPAPQTTRKGVLIKQKTKAELETELDELGTEAWLRKHQDQMDANYDLMADILNTTPQDIRDQLKALGYSFPVGA